MKAQRQDIELVELSETNAPRESMEQAPTVGSSSDTVLDNVSND